MEAMIPEKFYTKKEVAATLRVSIVTIGRLMKQKQISYCKVSKQPRFTKSDIQAYLKKTREQSSNKSGQV